MDNYFAELNNINVNEHVEKKNGLSYLSWAWAWGELKKRYPDATYTIYENGDGWFYHTDGRTGWVKTGVTVNGLEHIEYLPIMDYKNRSIPLEQITSFDVNKSIQRSLTKAVARHGIGLYIYAGEDLPEDAPKTTYKPNVDDSYLKEWDELRMKIYSLCDPDLCDKACKKKYGKKLFELEVPQLREILKTLEEKNDGAVG